MDKDNAIVKLCADGMSMEAQGNPAEAAKLFAQAWQSVTDDLEASIAAHYVARHQSTAGETLRWNQISLDRANLVNDERVRGFYPSLYLNVGKAHEDLDHLAEAKRFYELAEGVLDDLSDDRYGSMVRDAVRRGLERVTSPTARSDDFP